MRGPNHRVAPPSSCGSLCIFPVSKDGRSGSCTQSFWKHCLNTLDAQESLAPSHAKDAQFQRMWQALGHPLCLLIRYSHSEWFRVHCPSPRSRERLRDTDPLSDLPGRLQSHPLANVSAYPRDVSHGQTPPCHFQGNGLAAHTACSMPGSLVSLD